MKPQRIFALTFWFSIKDGLGIFKQLINWSSWKKGHLQSHSSWCVSVNWEFRKGAINSSRSWQIGIAVITLKFASIRETCLTHYSKVLWKNWFIPAPALFSGYVSNQGWSWWLSGLLSYAFPEWKIILCKGGLEYKRFYWTSFLP